MRSVRGAEAGAILSEGGRPRAAEMVPLTRKILSLSGRSIRQIAARQAHRKVEPDFHDKYGNIILAGGLVFCASIWTYVCTQTGITWNLSPIGKITPQEWRTD